MPPAHTARPALSTAATLLLVACEPTRPSGPTDPVEPATASAALSTYFPPSESNGGWRKASSNARDLGVDASKLSSLGSYLMSLPYENYATGVSGYHPANKAAIVVKDGWIVGEWYNRSEARSALYYLASNGKSIAMLLAGHIVQAYPGLSFGPQSKLYDQRWLREGFPLSDSRKSAITIDQVFRHTSGIIPEDQHQIADGAVQTESSWNFAPFTVGKDAQWPQSARLSYTPGQPGSYGGNTYSSVAFNHLSLIVRNITGKEASAALKSVVLDRIGVGRTAYKTTSGMGTVKFATAGNLLMTARDFMRIGYLMLHEGDWNGRRIFPASWLRQFTGSTAYRNFLSNRNCAWGAKYPADLYRTTGSGQNWVLVVPSLDLLLTFNGRTPASRKAEIDRESLKRLFAAVTERYVACDGTVINGG
jgi:beta-lactamase family protein